VSNLNTVFDSIFLGNAENTAQAIVDLVRASAFTYNGSPGFATQWSSSTGYTGQNNTLVHTNVTLGTGTVYALNDCHLIVKITNSPGNTNTGLGVRDTGTTGMTFFPQASGFQTIELNDLNAAGSNASQTANHLWLAQRENSSTQIKLYRDSAATLQATISSTSVSVPTSGDPTIGAVNGLSYDPDHSVGFYSFGKHLTNPSGCMSAIATYLSNF
jgi:hypothetical protein